MTQKNNNRPEQLVLTKPAQETVPPHTQGTWATTARRLPGYALDFGKGTLKGGLATIEQIGNGLTLGGLKALERQAWGSTFYDDVKKDAYDLGTMPGVLMELSGLYPELRTAIRGPGKGIMAIDARLQPVLNSIPYVGKVASKALPPALNIGSGAVYGASEARDLQEAKELAVQNAELAAMIELLAGPANRLAHMALKKVTQNKHVKPVLDKLHVNIELFKEDMQNRAYQRLSKMIGEDRLQKAYDTATRLKRSLIEVLDGDDIKRIQHGAAPTREVFANKRAMVRDKNAFDVQNVIGRHLGKATGAKTDEEILNFYRKQADPTYKALENIGDLEKHELKNSLNYKTQHVFSPNYKLTTEEQMKILGDQASELDKKIYGDIKHFTDNKRGAYVNSMTDTFLQPDIITPPNKNGRKYYIKKYLVPGKKNETEIFDFVIEENKKIFNKFPTNSEYVAGQLKEPINNPSIIGDIQQNIGIGPSTERKINLAQFNTNVNPLNSQNFKNSERLNLQASIKSPQTGDGLYVKDKNLIKGYRPVEDATLGIPSAKANLAKDVGMSPSEVREAILTHGLPNVKYYEQGYKKYYDTFLNDLPGSAARLTDPRGRPGRVPFLSQVGRVANYNPAIRQTIKDVKHTNGALAGLVDTDARVLLAARERLNRAAPVQKPAQKAVNDLDFALKTAYPDYQTVLSLAPDRHLYDRLVQNPRLNVLGTTLAPSVFKQRVQGIYPAAKTKLLQDARAGLMRHGTGRPTYDHVFDKTIQSKIKALTDAPTTQNMLAAARSGQKAIQNLNLAAKRPVPFRASSLFTASSPWDIPVNLFNEAKRQTSLFLTPRKELANVLTTPVQKMIKPNFSAPLIDFRQHINNYLRVPAIKYFGYENE